MWRSNWSRRPWGGWSRRSWGYQQPLCYSTPERLARRMVELSDIRPGMRVLEPSAGDGILADCIRAACPGAYLDVVEIQPALQSVLVQKGHRLVGADIFDCRAGPVYDRVVLNPPFTSLLDLWHIWYCFDFLKPGGRETTIASAESVNGPSTRSEAFRLWLRQQQAWTEALPGGPNGIFMESQRPTQVFTNLIVLQKPAQPVA